MTYFCRPILSCGDSGAKCYEALKAPDKLEELESLCNDGIINILVHELLDRLDISPKSEKDGISQQDRFTIFQAQYKDTAFNDLPASSWSLLDQFARLAPGFVIDSGSSIPSSPTTGLVPPHNSSTETILLYSVLEGMAQCAVFRKLNGSEFQSEAARILNVKAEGYNDALKLFTAHVWGKKRQDENDESVSDRTPVTDQMAKTAIHAFIGSFHGLGIYDSNEIDRLQDCIFQFKRPE